MTPKDRDYFRLRAHQEREAAAHSRGVVRNRHEELASAYEMRLVYFDRGLAADAAERREAAGPESIQHVIVPA